MVTLSFNSTVCASEDGPLTLLAVSVMAQLCDRVYACMINNFRAYSTKKKKNWALNAVTARQISATSRFFFSLGSGSYSGSRAVYCTSSLGVHH